jgi:hypothetical protein
MENGVVDWYQKQCQWFYKWFYQLHVSIMFIEISGIY